MAKKRTPLSSTIGTSQTDRKNRLNKVEQLEQLGSDKVQPKQRAMFYLSSHAIEALEDIVYTQKKNVGVEQKSSVNKSTVIERLILAEKARL